MLFILYPLYLEKGDVSSNLNAVWTDQYLTADQMRDETLLNQLVDYIKSNVAAQYETAGINMLRMDVVSTGLTQIGGLNAFYYVYSSTLSVQETVMDIYTKGAMVSGDFGTYTFTGTSTNMESLELFFDPLLSTLAWN